MKLKELYVAKVRTVCPSCEMGYQRPVTAEELHMGGAPKRIFCESCGGPGKIDEGEKLVRKY